MKLSLAWLKDFVKTDKSPEKLAQGLTLSGTEVEGIEYLKKDIKDIVVGEIITIISHPNTDKLKICKVRVKKGKVLKIVCGASNIKVGQLVPTALVGARLANGEILEKVKIRGVESEGIILAEDELGIGEDHEGIYILEDKEKIGRNITAVLGQNDIVLNLALTPNRADCFSVLGLAREISLLTKRKLNFSEDKFKLREIVNKTKDNLIVKVLDKDLCPKYTARIIENVKVGPSPEWLKNRLRATGVRPINNIVDVTNYVMMELGQPLHAFDYEALTGKKKTIMVRRAKKKEILKTLDDKVRELDQNMLVIADHQKAIALAGVMGGQDSEIKSKTTKVILEAAIFKPTSIRRTAARLGLRSESSNRFEKGLDYKMTEIASDRAAALIAKLSGGKVVPGIINISKDGFFKERKISLDLNLLNQYLNLKFPQVKVKQILKGLGFEIINLKGNILLAKVPSWRADVTIAEDLIEELGRIYDYNKLKPTYLKGTLKPVALPKDLYWERKIKDILAQAGLLESYNYSFYSEKNLRDFNLDPEKHYKIENPLNADQEYLRQSLVPLLLKNTVLNSQSYENLGLFEIGKVYLLSEKNLPKEEKRLGAIFYGDKAYFRGKGVLEMLLLDKLNIHDLKLEIKNNQKILIKAKDLVIGEFILVPKSKRELFKLKKPLVYFEIALEKLIKKTSEKGIFIKPSIHPRVIRDISFYMSKNIKYADLERELKGIDALVKDIELFDIFEREGKQSLALRFTFQASRTLVSEEVDEIVEKIYKILEEKYKLEVRK